MNLATNNTRVCPVEKAGGLDNNFRKFLQNPKKILTPFIKPGMTVLDLGCGPGFFSIDIAKLLGTSGKVIAADLQEGMLDKVKQKINGTDLEKTIVLHKCQPNMIDLSEKVDFVLIFYVMHEMPDQGHVFQELDKILNPGGQILIIEPKLHVSEQSFVTMTNKIKNMGFKTIGSPKVFFSRTVLLQK